MIIVLMLTLSFRRAKTDQFPGHCETMVGINMQSDSEGVGWIQEETSENENISEMRV